MDYQGNSKKQKEGKDKPEKIVEKVIVGEVVTRPMPLGTKFKTIFFGSSAKDVARFVAESVLLPALRKLVVDTVSEGAQRMMYGGSQQSMRRTPEYRPRVTYNNPIQRPALYPADPRSGRANLPDQYGTNRREGNQIIFANREEAELVLERLLDIINQFDVASLADLYDLVGLPTTHVDNKWGWTFMPGVQIRQVREGFLLDLPAAEPI